MRAKRVLEEVSLSFSCCGIDSTENFVHRSPFRAVQIPTTSGLLAQPQPRSNDAPIVQLPPTTWTPATDLVVKEGKKPQQSLQHSDIRQCISEAVNRATMNLFFVHPFPDVDTRNSWLQESLAQELTSRSRTNLFLREVNLRAKVDAVYFGQLFSMVSGFRTPCGNVVENPL
jgi:hypothetical protein